MSQRARILVAVAILVVLVAAVLAIDLWRRTSSTQVAGAGEPTLAPGSIPLRLDGKLVGSFSPTDLEQLEQVSFVDAEEGKNQDGWLLHDVILLHVQPVQLKSGSRIVVSSSSRNKSAELSWSEVEDPANYIMFDLSNRGTLKLVSMLERLGTRDEWVQDVDAIDITSR
jgi:hypothetical protein